MIEILDMKDVKGCNARRTGRASSERILSENQIQKNFRETTYSI